MADYKLSAMVGIGIRVYSYHRVYYCLIEQTGSGLNYLDISSLYVPIALQRPERLNFIRNTILDILNLYKVEKAVIRIAEFGSTLDKNAIERFYLEGVIQESLAGSDVKKFAAAQISEISSVAGIARMDFKKLANAELNFRFCPSGKSWANDFSLEERESIIASYTSLNL